MRPAATLARGVLACLRDGSSIAAGCTEGGDLVLRGDVLFELKATHGFPLDMALDEVMTTRGMAVDWQGFAAAARRGGWWDFQTWECVSHALIDAEIPGPFRAAIRERLRNWMLTNRHPMMEVVATGAGAAPGAQRPAP